MSRYPTTVASCIALAIAALAAQGAAARQTTPPPQESSPDPAIDGAPAPQAGGTANTLVTLLPDNKTDANRDGPQDSTKSIGDDVTVTGSRLQGGNPTARVTVITEAEIRARGVTSVEELIRTLPQNLATIGTLTDQRSNSPLSTRGKASVSTLGQLGVSAANLGGIGAANTLVLINGRRIAGAAGIEDGFVNLRNIPLNAIERVEITQDGASAIYGSDALGGVINFILKSDFQGFTLTAQQLKSSNDADVTRISAFTGVGWGSGNISGTIGFSRTNPIDNRKSGYVTQDYSDRYGGDPNFDGRQFSNGLQPGVAVQQVFVVDPATNNVTVTDNGYSVPRGFTGKPTLGDLVLLDPNSKRDYVPQYGGPKTDSFNVTLSIKQKITNKLSFYADGLFNRTKNTEVLDFGSGISILMFPGQYYNPFPAGWSNSGSDLTNVYYYPADEIAKGIIQPGTNSNFQTSWNVTAGLTYQFNRSLKLDLVYTASRSVSSGQSRNLSNTVYYQEDPNNPGNYTCYNAQLADPRAVTGAARAALQAAFDKQCTILTSSDPNVAFDPFKSSASGPGASAADFFFLQAVEDRSSVNQNVEARLSGVLLNLPGGRVQFAAGGEVVKDGVNSLEVLNYTARPIDRNRYAGFAEFTIPLLGKDFTLPLVKGLIVNLSGRVDSTVSEGAVGTVGGIPYDQGGQLIYASSRFTRLTPAYGVRWDVTRSLVLRGRWTQGFRAPEYSQLYNVAGTFAYPYYSIAGDPLYDCRTSAKGCDARGGDGYLAPLVSAPNPDLKPQTSTQQAYSATWQPHGGLFNGLSLVATYNRTRIRNQFAKFTDLYTYLPLAQQYGLAQFFPRDPSGRIIQVNNQVFNTVGSLYESLTLEGSYLFQTGIGTFEPKVTYLRNLTSEIQGFPNKPAISTLGKLNGNDRYKIVGSLGWYHHRLSATLWAYYTPSYLNDYLVQTFQGTELNPSIARPVRSLTTIDLTASWSVNNRLRLNFAGRNIFKAAPPFALVDFRPYDVARYNVAGRTLSLEAQLTF